jgi:hypothetical protein
MAYSKRVVLICPAGCSDDLGELVEACLKDAVGIICTVGPDASRIEDAVDWLIIGDGSDDSRFILTSAHHDETLDEVIDFAETFFKEESDQSVQIIELE